MADLLKREFLFAALAASLAFNIFQNFEDFIRFCNWISPYIQQWRQYTYNFWTFALSWLPFQTPSSFMDFLTTLLLTFVVFVRSERLCSKMLWTSGADEIRNILSSALSQFVFRTRLISSGFVMLFIVAPAFAPQESNAIHPSSIAGYFSLLYSYMATIAKVAFPIAVLFFMLGPGSTGRIEWRLSRTLMSGSFWRVIAIIVLLFAINFIGLQYDRVSVA